MIKLMISYENYSGIGDKYYFIIINICNQYYVIVVCLIFKVIGELFFEIFDIIKYNLYI